MYLCRNNSTLVSIIDIPPILLGYKFSVSYLTKSIISLVLSVFFLTLKIFERNVNNDNNINFEGTKEKKKE